MASRGKEGGHSDAPLNADAADWFHEPPFRWKDVVEIKDGKYVLECYCKRVQFTLTADPNDVKICHCNTCKVLHGAPMQTAAVFDKTAAYLTRGNEEDIAFLRSSDNDPHLTSLPADRPRKIYCASCTSPLADEGRNMLMVFPSSLRPLQDEVEVCRQESTSPSRSKGILYGLPSNFRIRKHIFYGLRAFDIPDGVEKWEGMDGKSRRMEDDGKII